MLLFTNFLLTQFSSIKTDFSTAPRSESPEAIAAIPLPQAPVEIPQGSGSDSGSPSFSEKKKEPEITLPTVPDSR